MYRVIPDNGICIGMGAENCVKYNTKCDSIVIRAFNKYNFIDFIKKEKRKKKKGHAEYNQSNSSNGKILRKIPLITCTM